VTKRNQRFRSDWIPTFHEGISFKTWIAQYDFSHLILTAARYKDYYDGQIKDPNKDETRRICVQMIKLLLQDDRVDPSFDNNEVLNILRKRPVCLMKYILQFKNTLNMYNIRIFFIFVMQFDIRIFDFF